MKTILAVAGAAGLLALAACDSGTGNKAAENKAEAIESNASNQADAITSNAQNQADAITSNASNQADAIRDNASAGNSSGNNH